MPDILANAGGVTVSYFEWVQGCQHFFWSEEEVNNRLIPLMQRAFRDVHGVSSSASVDLRTAALMRGIERIAEAKRGRGVFRRRLGHPQRSQQRRRLLPRRRPREARDLGARDVAEEAQQRGARLRERHRALGRLAEHEPCELDAARAQHAAAVSVWESVPR